MTNLKEFLTGLILLKMSMKMSSEFTDSPSFLVWKLGRWLGREPLTVEWEHLAGLRQNWESCTSELFGVSLANANSFLSSVWEDSPSETDVLQRMLNLLKNHHNHSFAVTRPLTRIKSQHALRQRLANFLKDQRANIFSFADYSTLLL